MISPFGALKGMNLIVNGPGKASSFIFEYEDPAAAAGAINSLNGLNLAETRLVIQRVPRDMADMLLKPKEAKTTEPNGQAAAAGAPATLAAAGAAAGGAGGLAGLPGSGLGSSTVLRLDAMVTEADLADEAEVGEIAEDVREESGRFGAVLEVLIPKLGEKGCGSVFVSFETDDAASRAQKVMNGRAFGDTKVQASFFDPMRFAARDFDAPLFGPPPGLPPAQAAEAAPAAAPAASEPAAEPAAAAEPVPAAAAYNPFESDETKDQDGGDVPISTGDDLD